MAQNRTTEAQPAEVSVRAFGDLGLVRTSGEGASFALGQLDAVVTASLSDRFRVLLETVAEANDAPCRNIAIKVIVPIEALPGMIRQAVGFLATQMMSSISNDDEPPTIFLH